MHDLKLAWSFMQNGFLASPFQRYFPNLPVRPPDDLLPASAILYPERSILPLADILRVTSSKLSSPRVSLPVSQRTFDGTSPEQGDQSIDSSFAMSSDANLTPTTPTKALSADEMSSPDTVEVKKAKEEVIVRDIEMEPWVWANTLLAQCEDLVKHAISNPNDGPETSPNSLDPGSGSFYAERSVAEVSPCLKFRRFC